MKLLSLFSGIGAFEKALDNENIPYELVNFCEFDKYAIKSYCAIHGVDESKNLGDITTVDTSKLPRDIDLVCYGFPCQDISSSGHMQGFTDNDGNRTRSGLFFEALRIIQDTKPKIAIAENVKNLVGKRFQKEFAIVLSSLEQAGYNNYWKIMNTKEYGNIPQNRERVFIVSIRKDIDKGQFKFPNPIPLEYKLKDFLEDNVDSKFYISKANNIVFRDTYIQWDNSGKGHRSQQDRAFYEDYVAPTISHCNSNGDKSQVVLGGTPLQQEVCNQAIEKGLVKPNDAIEYTYSNARLKEMENGYIRKQNIENNQVSPTNKTNADCLGICVEDKYYLSDKMKQYISQNGTKNFKNPDCKINLDIARPLTTDQNKRAGTTNYISKDVSGEFNLDPNNVTQLRIRKLTPKECFRLQGFSDLDFAKAESQVSNSQLYKQAGNSITVSVLQRLYQQIFDKDGNIIWLI